MKTDENEQFLWVATAAVSEMNSFTKQVEGKSEILKIDATTRKIVEQYSVEGSHVLGDLIMSKNNEVYVSDRAEPLIFKISDNEISILKDLRIEAFNLQRITFNEDQTKLFIADYLKGILVIDIKSNTHSWLKLPKDGTQKGIDGLVFYKNNLIAIHNGVTPIRIVKYHLNNVVNEIVAFTVLDNNRNEFNEPALASVFGDKCIFLLIFLGNCMIKILS